MDSLAAKANAHLIPAAPIDLLDRCTTFLDQKQCHTPVSISQRKLQGALLALYQTHVQFNTSSHASSTLTTARAGICGRSMSVYHRIFGAHIDAYALFGQEANHFQHSDAACYVKCCLPILRHHRQHVRHYATFNQYSQLAY